MKILEKLPPELQEYKRPDIGEIETKIRTRVAGQDEAVLRLSKELVAILSGIKTEKHCPRGSVLMLGPSGTGKTEAALAVMDYLLSHSVIPPGDRDPNKYLLKINCGEYHLEHQVARLMGSPAGYVGSKGSEGDAKKSKYIPPALGAESMEAHTITLEDGQRVTVVLLDEIEKAHESVRNYMLSALDKGEVETAANEKVDFTNTIFLFTSNLGNQEIAQVRASGIEPGEDKKAELRRIALTKRFRPEDVSRMSGSERGSIVFKELDRETSSKILGIQLELVEKQFAAQGIFLEFQLTAAARDRLLDMGVNPETGARALKDILKQQIYTPLLHPSQTKTREALKDKVIIVEFDPSKSEFVFYVDSNSKPAIRAMTEKESKQGGPAKGTEHVNREVDLKTLEELRSVGVNIDAQNLAIKFKFVGRGFTLSETWDFLNRAKDLEKFRVYKEGDHFNVEFVGKKRLVWQISANGLPVNLTISPDGATSWQSTSV